MSPPVKRHASHAGSWYSSLGQQLATQLNTWLDEVPNVIQPMFTSSEEFNVPIKNARIVIAPHAGYSYSGRAAAWAYAAADWSRAKRVFILGPSHHAYLTRCALSRCAVYETPLGDLDLDLPAIAKLEESGLFDRMSQTVDEDEHSIEMHLPYVYTMLSREFSSSEKLPPIVPILVGNTSSSTEKTFGELLAPYLADLSNVFVLSSDFAHWGSRFGYTYYQPSSASAYSLKNNSKPPRDPPIYDSIGHVDTLCMKAIESGDHKAFLNIIDKTGNTVCGRHPIGIMMAAMEYLRKKSPQESHPVPDDKFKFVRYERSSDCKTVQDSSVSYASAFAVI